MTPTDNENLQIQIIDEGLQIEISEKKYRLDNDKISIPMKGGTVKIEDEEIINRSEYDNKAKLYCSKFNKKISNPVFYKSIGYYKCVEIN